MNTTTRNIITAVKLIVVIGLLAYVFLRIQWQDSLIDKNVPSAEIVYKGEITGRWNQYPVEFITSDGHRKVIDSVEQSQTYQINPGFFTYITQANPVWLVSGSMVFILVTLFGAVRWYWLVNTQQLSLSLGQAVRLTWIGMFFNNFVPGQTGGDLVKAYYIAKNSPRKRLIAILTVITDRVLGLTALLFVGLLTVTVFFDRFKEIAVTLWISLILMLFGVVILTNRRIRRALGLSALVKKLPRKLTEFIYQVDSAIQQYHDHKAGILLWWLLSVGNHMVSILGVYAFSKAIDMGVPATEFYALVPVIFIVSALPIAPNGWGIGEALFGKLFGQYGAAYIPNSINAEQIMSTRGVALSILFRIINMCLSLIGGVLLLFSKDKIPASATGLEQRE